MCWYTRLLTRYYGRFWKWRVKSWISCTFIYQFPPRNHFWGVMLNIFYLYVAGMMPSILKSLFFSIPIFCFSGDSFKQHKLRARYFRMLAIVGYIFSWNLTKQELIWSETCNCFNTGPLCRAGVPGKLSSRVDSCWVQLPKVITFPHSCICCFSCPMDTQSIRPPMGLLFSASFLFDLCIIQFFFFSFHSL